MPDSVVASYLAAIDGARSPDEALEHSIGLQQYKQMYRVSYGWRCLRAGSWESSSFSAVRLKGGQWLLTDKLSGFATTWGTLDECQIEAASRA